MRRRRRMKRRMMRKRRRMMRSPALSQTTARRKWMSSYRRYNAIAGRAKTGTKQEYLIESHIHNNSLSHTHSHIQQHILKKIKSHG